MITCDEAKRLVLDSLKNDIVYGGIKGVILDEKTKEIDGVWVITWKPLEKPDDAYGFVFPNEEVVTHPTVLRYLVDQETGHLMAVGSRSTTSALLNLKLALERDLEK